MPKITKRQMKFLLVSIILILSLATQSWAIWGVPFIYWTPLEWGGIFKGVPANVDGLAKLDLDIRSLGIDCTNPGGNSSTSNSWVQLPHRVYVTDASASSDWVWVKGGKVVVDKETTSDDIETAAGLFPGDFCPNDGWTIDITTLRDFNAYITIILDDNTALKFSYIDCDFGPIPTHEPECAEFYSETFDWKK